MWLTPQVHPQCTCTRTRREARIVGNIKVDYLSRKAEDKAMRKIARLRDYYDAADNDHHHYGRRPDLSVPAVRNLHRRSSSALTLGSIIGGGGGGGGGRGGGRGSREKSHMIDDIESGSSTTITAGRMGRSNTWMAWLGLVTPVLISQLIIYYRGVAYGWRCPVVNIYT